MSKAIWVIGMIAANLAAVSPACAQAWHWQIGGGWGQVDGDGRGQRYEPDELADRLCSGERAHRLEARINHELEEGDIDPGAARWLHQMVDRNEEYQRSACRTGNGWQLRDVARRFDWIEQRTSMEEGGHHGW